MASVSELNQRLEDAREFAKANPYTVGSLLTASVSVFLSGLAYFSLRAKEHPSTPSARLPWDRFAGHVPALLQSLDDKTWLQKHIDVTCNEEASKAGIVTICMPNIQNRYIHAVISPKLIEELYNDSGFPKGDIVKVIYEEILGNSIFVSGYDQWRTHRQIISRMFTMNNLKNYMFNVGSRTTQRVVEKMKLLMTEDSSGNRTCTVDLFDVLGRFTMDSFVEISFGRECNSIESYPGGFEFGSAFDRAFERSNQRALEPTWKMKRWLGIGEEVQMSKDMKLIFDFIDRMLDMESRKQLVDETGVDKYDIISLFIRHSEKQLSEYDLRYIALSMIVAGRDTTRNLLAWCLALLCTSQQSWLEKVRDEINQIDSSELSYDDCQKKMRITECVLLETLRLYPAVVLSAREADRDLTLSNGYKIMKGDRMEIFHYAQARNKSVYGEDAAEFKPMRWYEKGLSTFPPSVFGAFHTDDRLCLGRKFALSEAKTFLFHFLRAFEHRSVGDKFPSLPASVLLIMDGGWNVQITEK